MRRQKGTITVFLTLVLLVIISLLTTVITSAIEQSMRMRTEMAMDMGMQSVFGEYSRALLKEYDLYFIDSGYGNKNGGSYYTAEHLRNYIDYNLKPEKGLLFSGSRSMFGMKTKDVRIAMESLATDNNAAVYKRQAIRYAKNKYGISIIEGIKGAKDEYKSSGVEDYDVEEARRENARRLKKVEDAKDEEGNPIGYDDPVEKIESKRSGIMKILLPESELSGRKIKASELVSYRDINSGSGIIANTENLNSLTNNLLFDVYLADKFSSYVENKGHDGMAYELEYILKGNAEDSKNLKETVRDLLILREGANMLFLQTDAKRKGEVQAIAAAVCLLIAMPELEKTVTEAILFAWSFAESCVDVRTLLNKGKVPLMKDDATWILSFHQALNFRAHLNDGKRVSSGLNYTSYLRLFLAKESSDKKVYRSMDMIETDLRKMKGNDHFKMDNCIEFIEARCEIINRYGRNYVIDRYFGYEAMPKYSY